jgi:hypothetical protein
MAEAKAIECEEVRDLISGKDPLTKKLLIREVADRMGKAVAEINGPVRAALDVLMESISQGRRIELRNIFCGKPALWKSREVTAWNSEGSYVRKTLPATLKYRMWANSFLRTI